jgi:tripartite-type tricarboxylate transporter receptor subunit TctC
VRSDEFSQRIVTLGGRPRASSADAFKAFLRSEVTRWGAVVKESGAKLE